jgi:hypothetical protein
MPAQFKIRHGQTAGVSMAIAQTVTCILHHDSDERGYFPDTDRSFDSWYLLSPPTPLGLSTQYPRVSSCRGKIVIFPWQEQLPASFRRASSAIASVTVMKSYSYDRLLRAITHFSVSCHIYLLWASTFKCPLLTSNSALFSRLFLK